MEEKMTQIALVRGGPAGLFMFKSLLHSNIKNLEVTIFERKMELGSGMPYSRQGANREHITNVSSNEIPRIVTSIQDWSQTVDKEILEYFSISVEDFNEYKVLPRLFFGYLRGQFELLVAWRKKRVLRRL